MADFRISKFSSLSFFDNWKVDFQKDEMYVQKFASSDQIRLQYSLPSWGEFDIVLVSCTNRVKLSSKYLGLSEDESNEWSIYEVVLPELEVGYYSIELISFGELADKASFCVLPDDDLRDTVLFTYSHRRNEFDVIFTNDNQDLTFFQWRVEGGFIPLETSFLVDNEFFRDQRSSLTQLSNNPYKVQTLTLGSDQGVPVWSAEKVNLILSLSTVLVNDSVYARSEGSTPQLTEMMPYYPLGIYKIDLEHIDNYNEIKGLPLIKVLGTEHIQILGTEQNQGQPIY